MRVVDAVCYLLQTGCQWRMLPRDFRRTARSTAISEGWAASGVWAHVNDVLYRQTLGLEGREERTSAAIIDSQSVKTGADAREMVGFDAGKRVKGRKRHLVTDMLGLSPRTVMKHVEQLLAKMDVENRTAAASLGHEKIMQP